jgi:hypothetical protein
VFAYPKVNVQVATIADLQRSKTPSAEVRETRVASGTHFTLNPQGCALNASGNHNSLMCVHPNGARTWNVIVILSPKSKSSKKHSWVFARTSIAREAT